jgi:hypothetical protein
MTGLPGCGYIFAVFAAHEMGNDINQAGYPKKAGGTNPMHNARSASAHGAIR